ncbi:MAG: ribulokinase [Candidatus Ratteibacteria bacterium]|nr:ribulokinase [Candidatus Ratteibacteria bacterium]
MYSLGLDFGTNSVRAVILNLESGEETASAVCNYPSGTDGIILDEKDLYLARQNPYDYLICMEKALKDVLRKAKKDKTFSHEKVVGIGVDTTGSTPLPVDEKLVPLAFYKEFKNNKNAMAYLWKDHTGTDEAEEITEVARKERPEYLSKIGGAYSSEWFFSKLLHLIRTDRNVFDAMVSFIELCDYIPAVLGGKRCPDEVVRSICAAGHKAMYNDEWGGLPDEEFLCKIDKRFSGIKKKLYQKAYPAGEIAGYLCHNWAKRTGLPEGIPISVGAFDAHMGAVGAGVRPGVLVKVIGTSTCDMTVAPMGKRLKDIPGICGMVPHSIIPGFVGIEAGQSAVGDIFNWFVKMFAPSKLKDPHRYYARLAEKMRPGETGLIALDWHNGNRCILVDQKLTGLIVGFTLNTRPEEVYRALIEATGFGGRVIIERMEEYGVEIKEIVATGGIPDKNPLLMQIYADITGRTFKIAKSSQTCAVGAAIFGAVAGRGKGGFESVKEAQKKICRFKDVVYRPNKGNKKIYDKLYLIYKDLHNVFGTKTANKNLYYVMKDLLDIRQGVK